LDSESSAERISNNLAQISDGFDEAYLPYAEKPDALLVALQKFARDGVSMMRGADRTGPANGFNEGLPAYGRPGY